MPVYTVLSTSEQIFGGKPPKLNNFEGLWVHGAPDPAVDFQAFLRNQ